MVIVFYIQLHNDTLALECGSASWGNETLGKSAFHYLKGPWTKIFWIDAIYDCII